MLLFQTTDVCFSLLLQQQTDMAIGKLGLAMTILMAISVPCSCAYAPADNYLVDCGSSTSTTIGSRVFEADSSPSAIAPTTPENIFASTANSTVPSSESSALYQTARVFTGPSSYSFPVHAGSRHFIRLHFFPFLYQSYNLATATFDVSTKETILLSNFQPQAYPLLKEYSLNASGDTLVLSFAPSGNSSLAFVNAIEVFSLPDILIVDTAQNINPRGSYKGLSKQLLETVYRINMGNNRSVSALEDTLWRTWEADDRFLYLNSSANPVTKTTKIQYGGMPTRETAPDVVYQTAKTSADSATMNEKFNVTWQFDVTARSSYLIRFHFCDVMSSSLNQLYFNVYVGSWLVVQGLDLSTLTTQTLASPYVLDCILGASDASSKLTVSISAKGLLNGLEIMKVYNYSDPAIVVGSTGSSKSYGVIVGSVLGAVGVLMAVLLVIWLLRRRKVESGEETKAWMPFLTSEWTSRSPGSKTSRTSHGTMSPGRSDGLGSPFSFVVLQEATGNFGESSVIGIGGFGKVYKGVLKDGTKVAVKRGNPMSQQGLHEFRTEIELLSRLRHRHLVSLVGYCDERNEKILVYEYMGMGALKSHLYGSSRPCLPWQTRLEICIGTARGLHYLHTGNATAIIHRDVKSANILLDENLVAKVADFGLSKTGPELDQTHVSTAVKGSFGYLDPEYYRRQQLTEKSDVYSFGVVLLEVLCARPVIDPTLPRDMVNLADWGTKWLERGQLHQIVDRRIAGTIRPESLRKFGEIIQKCLADYGADRPSMADVLWKLEYVLQLQQAEFEISDVNSINSLGHLALQVERISTPQRVGAAASDVSDLSDVSKSSFQVEKISTSVTSHSTTTAASDASQVSNISMSNIFSQLIESEGR